MKTIALDFDGTIHSYKTGWTAPDIILDEPNEGAFEAINNYLEAGFKVYIFSSRAANPLGLKAIIEWFNRHNFDLKTKSAVTIGAEKCPAQLYVDDRAWQYRGRFPSVEEVKDFVSYPEGGYSEDQYIIDKWFTQQAHKNVTSPNIELVKSLLASSVKVALAQGLAQEDIANLIGEITSGEINSSLDHNLGKAGVALLAISARTGYNADKEVQLQMKRNRTLGKLEQ